jgi:hypothetical protein
VKERVQQMVRGCWEAKTILPAATSMSKRIIPEELTPPVSPTRDRGSVTARLPLLKPAKPQAWDDDIEVQQSGQRSSVTGVKPAAQQRRIKPKQALFIMFGLIEVVSLGELHTLLVRLNLNRGCI